jgi:hypothetical protein
LQLIADTTNAPTAAVTARHCTPWIDIALEFGGTPALSFGSSAWAPEQLVPIKSYVSAPPSPTHPGLLLDGGRDVAVAYLESVPIGIIPAKLGRFKGSMRRSTAAPRARSKSNLSRRGATASKGARDGHVPVLRWLSSLIVGLDPDQTNEIVLGLLLAEMRWRRGGPNPGSLNEGLEKSKPLALLARNTDVE